MFRDVHMIVTALREPAEFNNKQKKNKVRNKVNKKSSVSKIKTKSKTYRRLFQKLTGKFIRNPLVTLSKTYY
ncbi:MAG: hypothetical protein D3920_14000 [Candidatus Electrothrix sp. AW2]|nr:hypothetical protein [Candidatus Electrothrix sp. AX1]MCI5136146.1 hypothetical protein [Candidatus Electrothrix gigas]MCI5183835.1 hypothetical protein [Candidatus Electrothrix gigas]